MTDRMSMWVEAMRSDRFEAAWELATQSLAERNPSDRDDPSSPYHQRWVWDGRSFDDRRVLVRCYHGLGDTLQFARYLPFLAKRAASVTLEVHPRLIPLLQQIDGLTRLHPFDPARPLPPSECDLEITELDFALRVPANAAPSPYLHATRALLPKDTVALCYGSGEWDAERSIDPALFARLCRNTPCLTLMPEPTALDVLNREGCPFDMDVTTALVAGASLVITVDTMIAHLAGALGRPVWLLLKAEPDWRWNPARTTSSWYPTMRLYAQPAAGDWASVITRVEQDLAARTSIAVER